MTSIITTVGETIQTIKAWWDEQLWLASDEHRELVKHHLALHQRAMQDGSCKSPYFED